MANKPKKVAVIGLDCALPHLIEQHIAEGHLPTFKKLIEEGVIAENCLAPFPTITPPNWATIATGAGLAPTASPNSTCRSQELHWTALTASRPSAASVARQSISGMRWIKWERSASC